MKAPSLLSILLVFIAPPAFSQTASTLNVLTPYSIERTQVIDIHSVVLGRHYQLFVKLPRSYEASNKLFPVLFLNDAGYAFPLVSSLERQMTGAGIVDDFIIIGISYSVGDSAGLSRTRDYTPTYSPNEANSHSYAARQASGHADDYLKFISDEIFPLVENNFRVDMSAKTLAGHSYGGLFAAYVLGVDATVFDNYIISDPSLWYDDKAVFDLMKNEPSSNTNVLIVAANPNPEDDSDFLGMIGNTRMLKQKLENNSGADAVQLLIFDEEIHETIFPIAISHGMRMFFN